MTSYVLLPYVRTHLETVYPVCMLCHMTGGMGHSFVLPFIFFFLTDDTVMEIWSNYDKITNKNKIIFGSSAKDDKETVAQETLAQGNLFPRCSSLGCFV